MTRFFEPKVRVTGLLHATGALAALGTVAGFFRRLLARSGLIDTLRGRGYQPTWPGHFVPLWIPLDHCLVSPDLTVLDRRVGPHVGSDHRPVIVDLAFPIAHEPLSMNCWPLKAGR